MTHALFFCLEISAALNPARYCMHQHQLIPPIISSDFSMVFSSELNFYLIAVMLMAAVFPMGARVFAESVVVHPCFAVAISVCLFLHLRCAS